MKTTITMLGTGHATVTKCYNTCFVIQNEKEYFLVDAGGGNGIMVQLEKAGIGFEQIHHMFLTHGHTDHMLGAVWVVRCIAMRMRNGKYEGDFHIYANAKAGGMLKTICEMTLFEGDRQYLGKRIWIHEVRDGEKVEISGMKMTFFDVFSTKEAQFGFRAVLPDGQVLACLGDEPYNEVCRPYVEGCDWLMSEAFCLYKEKYIFKPYEKCHSTALDAGKVARMLNAKNLIIYHTEDKNLSQRKELYTKEAQEEFSGNIYVPKDLEQIVISE